MKCGNCNEDIISDGHGEHVHEETLAYGCAPRVKRGASYPVAIPS